MIAKVYWIPGPWRGRIGIAPRPRGGDWLDDEMRALKRAQVDVVVSMLTDPEVDELGLTNEADAANTAGLGFRRLPILDRGVPESRSALEGLVCELTAELDDGKNVVVHCRQGIGRSSVLVASIFVCASVGVDHAFEIIEAARGRPVPDTTEQKDWIRGFARSTAQVEI